MTNTEKFTKLFNATKDGLFVKFGVMTAAGDFRIRYGRVEKLTPDYVTIFDSFKAANRTARLEQITGIDS